MAKLALVAQGEVRVVDEELDGALLLLPEVDQAAFLEGTLVESVDLGLFLEAQDVERGGVPQEGRLEAGREIGLFGGEVRVAQPTAWPTPEACRRAARSAARAASARSRSWRRTSQIGAIRFSARR